MFDCSCRGLTSLVGVVPEGTTNVDVSENQLISLAGLPKSVTVVNCSSNSVISLVGCPPLLKELYCSDNALISLKALPSSVTALDVSGNDLTSLVGLPASLVELYCSYNQLVSLEGLTTSVTELECFENPLPPGYAYKSVEEIHLINRIENFRKGLEILRRAVRHHQGQYLRNLWETYWYVPNTEGVARCAERSHALFFSEGGVSKSERSS